MGGEGVPLRYTLTLQYAVYKNVYISMRENLGNRILIFLILVSAGILMSEAMEKEEIKYVVSYKWGLIQKDAGDARITKMPKDGGYELKLIASTKPWADRIYKMRDTLISMVGLHKHLPIKYTRLAHEKNKYSRDEIIFTHSGTHSQGKGIKYREKKDGSVYQKDIEVEGLAPAYDILSIFFYIRDLDFDSLKPSETVKTSIFSGDQSEKLTLYCKGKETIKLKDKTEAEAWHVVFKFTSKGGTKSSDDIDCWISADERRIPLLIIASLPVGQIRCNYEP